ncbi:myb family transcription factor EFM [Brassica rapa]|uniref:myb family transcription factor EFM n=1 Tax=Brassica campestris TaxID=3711 RepID=UPI00142E149E|nr:myb family transcription factor EFM [Brassica rapa]
MASSSELSLDCKPQRYSMLLKSFGDNFQSDQTTQKLEDLLSRLEQERLKIDAFKRELPLCMQLLGNAVEVYRQQLEAYRENSNNSNQSVVARPVLEEFIPLRNTPEKENNKGNNWMTTAQLWSQPETKPKNIDPTTDQSPKDELASSPKLGHFDVKQRNGGGAFLPFSKEKTLPELALSTEVKRVSPANEHTNDHDCNGESMINGSNNNNNNNSSTTSQSNRKARRCWSPDLHRRFVQALQMLGGSQVATPKQIRELMKVDGLTNDEVKSHLQKYRLHTRRPSPSPQTSGGQGPHLVVLGGIWVPPEYTTAHGGTPTLYHHQVQNHQGNAAVQPPPHFCSSQEFYTARPPPQQLHHHHFQTCNGSSADGSASTDSAHQLTDSAADDGKSPESGGGERKGLAALREESGNQSNINGSEITLKF